MTKTLDLMVDIDEVIFPLIDSIHQMAFERGLHDGSVGPEWKGWEVYGCTEQEYWDLWSDFSLNGGYTSTPPIAGSVEILRDLHLDGHRIHLVTARGFMANAKRIRAWTPAWLEEFAVPHASLTFAKSKPQAMRKLGVHFDAAIDDSPKNFTELSEALVTTWLQHHHHNREFETDYRVSDLAEFATLVRRMA